MSGVHSESRDEELGQIVDQFLRECREGKDPSVDQLAQWHPEFADDLRELLPTLAMMEQAKSEKKESERLVDHAEAMIDRKLGDYQILREIGRGGMGVVYEAEQISLGRHVAIKVMPKQVALRHDHTVRFEREAKAAARLHHTNIVPVFGVGEDDEVSYYVMQYIHGLGLDEVLRELEGGRDQPESGTPQSRRFEKSWHSHSSTDSSSSGNSRNPYWLNVARIGFQVSDALRYAHEQGVSHRDIKPSNLLLDLNNDVWITDFGLAKADDDAGLTKTGDILGTIRYMPPEAFDGQADNRGDLYSLGITLYELVTLQPAFEADDRRELIKLVTMTRPAPIARQAPSVPRDLATIIEKAIEVDPQDRYQTASELEEDLRRFIADEPVLARRIGLAERAVRWARQNSALAASIAGMITLLSILAIGGFSAAMYFFAQEEKQRGLLEKTLVMSTANESLLGGLKVALKESDKATQAAIQARDGAERQNERTLDSLYASDVGNAIRAMKSHNGYERARVLLGKWRPETGKRDRRGWEWYFAQSLCNEHHYQIDAHEGPVNAIALDSSRTRLASGGNDGFVRIWNLEDRSTASSLESPVGVPLRLAWDPSSNRLAVGGDHGLAVVDGITGRTLYSSLSLFRICGLEWSREGKKLAIASSMRGVWGATGTFSVLDASDFRVLGVPTGKPNRAEGRITQMDWSFNDDRLVYLAGDNVNIWDVESNKLKQTLRAKNGGLVLTATYRGNQVDQVLVTRRFGSSTLFDVNSGSVAKQFSSPAQGIRRVRWKADGSGFVSVSGDGTVRLWQADDERETRLLQGHVGEVQALEFDQQAGRVYSAGRQGRIKCWDITEKPLQRSVAKLPGLIRACALSPSGKKVVSSTGGVIHFIDLTNDQASSSEGSMGTIRKLIYSHDGSQLLASSFRGIALFDSQTHEKLKAVKVAGGNVLSVDWTSDGTLMAIGQGNGDVQFFDSLLDQVEMPLNTRESAVRCVRWNPNGTTLAIGDDSTGVCLWDRRSGKTQVFSERDTATLQMAWSPSGERLAAANSDHVVRIYDSSLQQQAAFREETSDMRTLKFSPDGSRLLAVDRLGSLLIFDLDSGRVVFRAQAGVGETFAADWSDDGKKIICSIGDSIELWDASGGYTLEQARQSVP